MTRWALTAAAAFLLTPTLSHAEISNNGGLFIEPTGRSQVRHAPLVDLRNPRSCDSRSSLNCGHDNNRNYFDDRRADRSGFNASGGCRSNTRCPSGTALVCNADYSTKVCMDVELRTNENSGQPQGLQTMHSCQRYCEDRGMRLPTNNEWLVASLGTDPRSCLPQGTLDARGGIHPNKPTPPANQSYNDRYIRNSRNSCESIYGVRDMIGVLGQWVTNGHARSNRAQFNGGYWAFNPSSVFYRTTAHGPGYTDYSIGCRCATNAR